MSNLGLEISVFDTFLNGLSHYFCGKNGYKIIDPSPAELYYIKVR
jgi:hypothetical protein